MTLMNQRLSFKRYVVNDQEFIYERKSRVRIRAPWGTSAFDAETARIKASSKKLHFTQAGTLKDAIESFQSADQYRQHNLRRRAAFQSVIDWLPYREAHTALGEIDAPFARRLRDKASRARGARFANYVLLLLHAVVSHHVEIGLLANNPTIGVSKIKLSKSATANNRRALRPPCGIIQAR